MKFKKIRIPILGIISIILSYYFVILQPKITYSIGKSKFNYSTARGYSNNDIAFLCELSIKLKNKGIKPSYLKKIEIHPVDMYLDSFSIINTEFYWFSFNIAGNTLCFTGEPPRRHGHRFCVLTQRRINKLKNCLIKVVW